MELSTIKQQINQLLDQYEKEHKEIGSISGTLLLNFGETGTVEKGLCNRNQRPFQMLLNVLEYYVVHKQDKDFQDWKSKTILDTDYLLENNIFSAKDLYEYYLKNHKQQ